MHSKQYILNVTSKVRLQYVKKNTETKCISVQVSKNLKGPQFHCQKCVDQKYL